MSKSKHELYCFNHETKDNEIFVCECGRTEFKFFNSEHDHQGTIEEMLLCDCGIVYKWAYGDIVNKIDNGIDWLIKRTEDSFRFSSNLYYTRMELNEAEKKNEDYYKVINNIVEKAALFGVSEEVYDAMKDAIKIVEESKNRIIK